MWNATIPASLPAQGNGQRFFAPYPGLPRFCFVRFTGDLETAMAYFGQPIRYRYFKDPPGLDAYQTFFAASRSA